MDKAFVLRLIFEKAAAKKGIFSLPHTPAMHIMNCLHIFIYFFCGVRLAF